MAKFSDAIVPYGGLAKDQQNSGDEREGEACKNGQATSQGGWLVVGFSATRMIDPSPLAASSCPEGEGEACGDKCGDQCGEIGILWEAHGGR